jgi:hypothetical protein
MAKQNIHLTRPEDVRRLLSATINEVRRGEVEPNIAAKIGYLANILLAAFKEIKSEEMYERMQELDELLKDTEEGNG